MAHEILSRLCSSTKLERDRGLQAFEEYLKTITEADIQFFEEEFEKLLETDVRWEMKHGALIGSKSLLMTEKNTPEFGQRLQGYAMGHLEDEESRIRLASGEVVGALCTRYGPEVYMENKDVILEGVRSNLERQPHSESSEKEKEQTEKLMMKLSSSSPSSSPEVSPSTSPRASFAPKGLQRQSSTESARIFHDTAGWKSLETWMKCLQNVIENCGYQFNPYVDQELLDLIFNALSHTNRFVRETGYYVCSSLVGCGLNEKDPTAELTSDNAIFRHGDQFSEYLARGLADNWSQVRLAASVATRKFLESIHTEEAREPFYPALIPRMCLNRYYVAEGVRIYSQTTWKEVTHTEGRHLVEKYIDHVVDFYIDQSEADNHAVREAACACIAELGSKIDQDTVRPHIHNLLETLLVCFRDESWPVRDAACVACGNFILCFPEESRETIPELYPLFFENLHDNIPSVRQGAALALANVVKAYGNEAASIVLGKVKEGLAGVEKQPANTEKYSGLDKSPATFGVVKRARDNDMELHTDKPMYSCGSLAPRMSRGQRGGGCMDHKFKRPSELWELGEGCVHVVAELSQNADMHKDVCQLLPQVAKATNFTHYSQHTVFLETVCKELPTIAKGLGKRPFKMYLELFLDSIFYSLSCDHALTSAAASQCLAFLVQFLGPNIIRGRIEQYNPRYLQQFDANIHAAMPPV